MDKVLLVFLGGGIGSVLRYVLQLGLNDRWPWGTLLANVLGCAAAGAIAALASTRLALDDHARAILAAGFLGGFTTFSAFAAEAVTQGPRGVWYALATNVGAIGAAYATYTIVRALAR